MLGKVIIIIAERKGSMLMGGKVSYEITYAHANKHTLVYTHPFNWRVIVKEWLLRAFSPPERALFCVWCFLGNAELTGLPELPM